MSALTVIYSQARDGDMLVPKRRERLYARYALNANDIALMAAGRRGDVCTWIGTENGNRMIEADALLTKECDIVLGLLTADCLPVVFHEPVAGIGALAHCGFAGVDVRLVERVVREIEQTGGEAQKTLVRIGPSIRKESYAVPLEKLSQRDDPVWQPFIAEDVDDLWHVDLAGFVHAQLVGVGVLPEHIKESEVDTFVDMRYFSHRRARDTNEPDGRFLTLVWQHGQAARQGVQSTH